MEQFADIFYLKNLNSVSLNNLLLCLSNLKVFMNFQAVLKSAIFYSLYQHCFITVLCREKFVVNAILIVACICWLPYFIWWLRSIIGFRSNCYEARRTLNDKWKSLSDYIVPASLFGNWRYEIMILIDRW